MFWIIFIIIYIIWGSILWKTGALKDDGSDPHQ